MSISCVGLFESASAETLPTLGSWTYGGALDEDGQELLATSDGGYIIAGSTKSYGASHYDVMLLKVDSLGNEEWHKTYGGVNADCGYAIVATSDGGYAIAGYTASYGSGTDIWLIKVDSSGNVEWNKTYGGGGIEYGYDMIATSDGGFAIVGRTNSYGAGGFDVWLVKVDASGTLEWSQAYGGTGTEYGYGLVACSDGGYAIAGYTNSYGSGNYDVWLIKTDSSGGTEWTKTYGSNNAEYGYDLTATSDGGYAIIGQRYFSGKYYDVWLVKVDSSGTVQWNKNYGGNGQDCGYGVIATSDGGYALTGTYVAVFNGDINLWLAKVDSSGNVEWDRTFGGASTDVGYGLTATYGAGYAVVGYTKSSGAGNSDIWLIAVDSAGGFTGLFVLPEFVWGGLAAIIACFGAFLAFRIRSNSNPLKRL